MVMKYTCPVCMTTYHSLAYHRVKERYGIALCLYCIVIEGVRRELREEVANDESK